MAIFLHAKRRYLPVKLLGYVQDNNTGDKMRQETTTRTLYTFDELSPAAKVKALDACREINMDDWHESVYEDAERAGLKITGSDVGSGGYCEGEFISGALDCATAILKDHGEKTGTFKTAAAYIVKRDEAIAAIPADENGDPDTWAIDEALDGVDAEFLRALLADYLVMLRKEYEYQYSDEAVRDSIEANGYEFTEEGAQA